MEKSQKLTSSPALDFLATRINFIDWTAWIIRDLQSFFDNLKFQVVISSPNCTWKGCFLENIFSHNFRMWPEVVAIFYPFPKTTPNRSPPKKNLNVLSIVFELFIGKLRIVARGSSTAHSAKEMGEFFFNRNPTSGKPSWAEAAIQLEVVGSQFRRVLRSNHPRDLHLNRPTEEILRFVGNFPSKTFPFLWWKAGSPANKHFLETFSQVKERIGFIPTSTYSASVMTH